MAEPMAHNRQGAGPAGPTTAGLLMVAKLLERLVEECARTTPSHSWLDMKALRDDARALRENLEKL